MKIVMQLSASSIDEAIKKVRRIEKDLKDKQTLFAKKVADLGVDLLRMKVAPHNHGTGQTLSSISVEDLGGGRFAVYAQSEAILFMEFGAGIRYSGTTHPKSGEFGMGPGTYPSEREGGSQWDNPDGWWYPKKDGSGYAHTYGNPAHMPVYLTAQDLRRELGKIAKEVFGIHD